MVRIRRLEECTLGSRLRAPVRIIAVIVVDACLLLVRLVLVLLLLRAAMLVVVIRHLAPSKHTLRQLRPGET